MLDYTKRFDRLDVERVADLEVPAAALQASFDGLGAVDREALELAADRIRRYHATQSEQIGGSWDYHDDLGNRLGQRVLPLARVGIYVPGGAASYPSTVLMTAIPARVAGVGEVVMVVPTPDGVRNALVLAAAHVAQVDRVICIGGAQAIGALAYGTQSIGRVDKIVGPGGAYVAAAKRLVFGPVGIDMIAGPSEILIIADGTCDPAWVAMDMFSQAEHDPLAQAILLTPDAAYLQQVAAAIRRLLPSQPRAEFIRAALERRGALILTRDLAEATTLANQVAPGHLQLAVADADTWLGAYENAGAIFLGPRTGEVMGDYVAGPSHVLPTFGTARFSSPLGIYDFQKRSSVISISETGLERLGRAAAQLAHGEGLSAHAGAAEIRLGITGNEPE